MPQDQAIRPGAGRLLAEKIGALWEMLGVGAPLLWP